MEGREYCLAFSLLFSLSVYFCCFSTLYFYCILFIIILCFSTAAGLLQQTNFSNGGLIIKLYRIVSYITSNGIGTQEEYPPPHTHTHSSEWLERKTQPSLLSSGRYKPRSASSASYRQTRWLFLHMLLYILPLKQTPLSFLRHRRWHHAETQTGLHTHKHKTVGPTCSQPYISPGPLFNRCFPFVGISVEQCHTT